MCGVVEGLHLKIVLRISSCENIYDELRFHSVNNKVYKVFIRQCKVPGQIGTNRVRSLFLLTANLQICVTLDHLGLLHVNISKVCFS